MIDRLMDRLAGPRTPSNADEWLARAKSRHFDDAQKRLLEKWLDADPRNRAEYEGCSRVSEMGVALRARADLVKAMPIYEQLARAPERPAPGNRWLMAGAAAAACTLLTVLLVPRIGTVDQPSTFATRLGEQREVVLKDGSKIFLNTDSTLQVAFTEGERRVHLDRGEGYFEVVKDSSGRHFIVEAGTTEVRVVGTRFSVRASERGTDVVVSEGKVEVVPDKRGQSASTPAKVELVPGNALRFDRRESFVHVAAVDPELATAWRTGTIRFENSSVEEVIGEVNRYSRTPFVLAAHERVKDIRMSGSFKVGDIDAVRFVLRDGYGIESVVEDGRIVLR